MALEYKWSQCDVNNRIPNTEIAPITYDAPG